jgi:nucleotide-binding universal stress UspA family protein
MEGNAKHVLMDAVAKYHADILIVGSHGYNSVQRFLIIYFPYL